MCCSTMCTMYIGSGVSPAWVSVCLCWKRFLVRRSWCVILLSVLHSSGDVCFGVMQRFSRTKRLLRHRLAFFSFHCAHADSNRCSHLLWLSSLLVCSCFLHLYGIKKKRSVIVENKKWRIENLELNDLLSFGFSGWRFFKVLNYL